MAGKDRDPPAAETNTGSRIDPPRTRIPATTSRRLIATPTTCHWIGYLPEASRRDCGGDPLETPADASRDHGSATRPTLGGPPLLPAPPQEKDKGYRGNEDYEGGQR